MEFPDVGKHCSQSDCKQLDFLPVNCTACNKVFCKDHFAYESHNCQEAYKKDNQVPVCPLCSKPIPVKKGEMPDVKVSQHIDTDCQSDPAKEKRKIYTNRCSFKGCKQKELIPFRCDKCQNNHCLRHRHEKDHECNGFENTGRGISREGAAALSRFSQTAPSGGASKQKQGKPQQTNLSRIGNDLDRERRERQMSQQTRSPGQSLQAGLTEDEALARAMALSLQEGNTPATANSADQRKKQQEDADMALAMSLAAREEEAARGQTRRQQSKEKSCAVS